MDLLPNVHVSCSGGTRREGSTPLECGGCDAPRGKFFCRVTRQSRAMLVSRLRSQKARLEFGMVEHLGLMCQLPLPSGARMPEPARFKL